MAREWTQRDQAKRRAEDWSLDSACASLHERLLDHSQPPLTAVDYLSSWEFAEMTLASERHEKRSDA